MTNADPFSSLGLGLRPKGLGDPSRQGTVLPYSGAEREVRDLAHLPNCKALPAACAEGLLRLSELARALPVKVGQRGRQTSDRF